MAADSEVKIDVKMSFPKAGVVIVIEAAPDRSFRLTATDAANGRTVPLSAEASPQFADWARGYARWLFRANVKASQDEGGITGSFVGDLTPEQVLGGMRDACDMIRQRFDLYEESVLA